MGFNKPPSLKKHTLLFATLKDLVAFQKKVNPRGYLMVPQVNLICGSFSDEDIELAVNQFNGVIKTNIDINSFIHE